MAPLLHEVDTPTKEATFGMACFWAPDCLFGATPGVIRTKVGYTGGSKGTPSYHNLSDHTEAIHIEYDPKEIDYSTLLKLFWENHNPSARMKLQYTSMIWYHDNEQKELAESTLKEQENKHKLPIVTKIAPASTFYDAEDYHQKYRLQGHPWLCEAIGMKSGAKLKNSHLAARLNGYVIGCGGVNQFNAEVGKLGLDEKTADYVRKLVIKNEGNGLTC
ncbi:unnamed protein product [Bemisia tabaci]|nr:PREDICTED: peptide methionine sulfoxide reductase isoform X2 [Bemisia tabaci]XP_018906598.1 PREDICTED: peptide methionine sulfoxide reductase isoform X2 [Bemisia tabaci]CAH0770749.1 unnamed protein product [Bemisia tabaci]